MPSVDFTSNNTSQNAYWIIRGRPLTMHAARHTPRVLKLIGQHAC